jgi:hypothetical protein
LRELKQLITISFAYSSPKIDCLYKEKENTGFATDMVAEILKEVQKREGVKVVKNK